ncbi:N-acetylmuramoyl-L-alanine amidase [Palleronia marisminoris]|uniref:N-acetylmuramoyl-L-alanine amidase n=1 Tax=Palleronia marisminoris TaxID=315423 RepID=A0A1Y5RDJ2_9RHOB|nr:N-acetylmuramoyl-L-alanine amidase [Palleronia marisminoris]SFG14148.1 N-acetylmuramoyl-L-alanine amidase [Palleronia marisminoris]SLN14897.1 N-acetylmuramoyl-L-alanine amidase AmiC precursor [Palleronia marisminoris]
MEFRRLAIGLIVAACLGAPAVTQDFTADDWNGGAPAPPSDVPAPSSGLTALARIDTDQSRIEDFGANLHVELALSQPVPWRVFTLDAPRRLVIDFSEVDFTGAELANLHASDHVQGLYRGRFREGWSRLVVELANPLRIETAGLVTTGVEGAVLKLQLAPTTAERFSAEAGVPEGAAFALPSPENVPVPSLRQSGDRPLRVTLDPGHGGFDPGAEADGIKEADLVLTFAKELSEVLEGHGMKVSLTREDDRFVPLPRRVSLARRAEADVFLSLHADALEDGLASGATVYTLSEDASDDASRMLAERMDHGDLLIGVETGVADDAVASVLLDMVRRETGPRSEALGDEIVAGLAQATGDLHKRPRLKADFSVLRAADIPSVLIELGFMSSSSDRARLTDPVWRTRAADGIRVGLQTWARRDALEAQRLMQ